MRKVASLGFLTLSLVACGDSAVAPSAVALAGTYALVTVDGSPLPFVSIETVDYKDEIIAGSVTLREDGRYDDETLYGITRFGVREEKAFVIRGTWTVDGNTVTFRPDASYNPGRWYTMRVDGTRLTLVDAGVTSVFQR